MCLGAASNPDFFTAVNGVKYGAILSPALFSVYKDDVLRVLCDAGFGC